jgi:hypothetical protein
MDTEAISRAVRAQKGGSYGAADGAAAPGPAKAVAEFKNDDITRLVAQNDLIVLSGWAISKGGVVLTPSPSTSPQTRPLGPTQPS